MNTKRPPAPWKPLLRSALVTALVGNIDRSITPGSNACRREIDTANNPGNCEVKSSEEGKIGYSTGARRRAPSAAAPPRAGLGFLGLDLSYNAIGTAGIVALGQALLGVPGMISLEVRGNADDVTDISHSRGGRHPSPAAAVLEEVEKTCTERRERLISARLMERRVASLNCSREAPRPGRDASSEPIEGRGGAGAKEGDGIRPGGRHERTAGSSPKKNNQRRNQNTSPMTNATIPYEQTHEASGCGRCDGEQQRGACARATAMRLERRTERSSPGERAFGAVKPRPLEGSLPLRGYYISPLLDSHFDLLMLREPAPDPADPGSYVNKTRSKLEQSRLSRERRDGDSITERKSSSFAAGTLGETAQSCSRWVECCTYIWYHCDPLW